MEVNCLQIICSCWLGNFVRWGPGPCSIHFSPLPRQASSLHSLCPARRVSFSALADGKQLDSQLCIRVKPCSLYASTLPLSSHRESSNVETFGGVITILWWGYKQRSGLLLNILQNMPPKMSLVPKWVTVLPSQQVYLTLISLGLPPLHCDLEILSWVLDSSHSLPISLVVWCPVFD